MAEHDTEPALVYDAGERRTHDQHAIEAYDFAARGDDLRAMVKSSMNPMLTQMNAETCDRRAQWHATMAVYASLMPSPDPAPASRASAFNEDERAILIYALEPFSQLLVSSRAFKDAVTALLEEFRA